MTTTAHALAPSQPAAPSLAKQRAGLLLGKEAERVSPILRRNVDRAGGWLQRVERALDGAEDLLRLGAQRENIRVARHATRVLGDLPQMRAWLKAAKASRVNANLTVGGTIEMPVTRTVARSGWMVTFAQQAMSASAGIAFTMATHLDVYRRLLVETDELTNIEDAKLDVVIPELRRLSRTGSRFGQAIDNELLRVA